ncbi:MAG: RagB/SusD family nutrient uptake outer membrane protein [Bacteroidia bacterium]
MKAIKHILFLLMLATTLAPGCQEGFLERYPEDQLTADNFYTTPEQVGQATIGLYNKPWFDFMDKAVWALGDLTSGNLVTFDPATVNFKLLAIGSDNTRLTETWRSLYNVIAQSNYVINTLPDKAAGIDEALVLRSVGEARFMRALAYFYLVRAWGAVPIIEDNEKYIFDSQVPRHTVDDIYRFIIEDLEYAAAHCPLRSAYAGADLGRVSRGAAQTLLAKVYLYRKDYSRARAQIEEVVQSGEYGLAGLDYDSGNAEQAYEDLFTIKGNNSRESVFQIQWAAMQLDFGNFGVQSTMQAYFAPFGQGLTGTWDGWGAAEPSIDLQRAFENGDLRKKGTMMTPGAYYASLLKADGGYTYPSDNPPGGTRASIKKYVVGRPEDENGTIGPMNTVVNTHILRYAEVLLIHAEAILAGGTSTTDAAALASFNRVRQRAGLPAKSELTFDDILQERRVELAFEGDYWYDLGRIDRATAIEIISNQERGNYGPGTPPPVYTLQVVPTSASFLMPMTAGEVAKNPRLLEDPVPFY